MKHFFKTMNGAEKLILALIIIAIIAILSVSVAHADHMGFILCNPDTTVNMRFEPRKTGTVVACMECGDPVRLDGGKYGEWLHVVTGDENGAWVHQGYVVDIKVTVETRQARAKTKVRTRNMVRGRLTGTLRKGQEVTVYAYSEECCFTSKGYIKTKYLEVE